MGEKYLFRTDQFINWLAVGQFLIFILLILFSQTVGAQSQCLIGSDGLLQCDLSVALIEQKDNDDAKSAEEWPWQPSAEERDAIRVQLEKFSEVWCNVTLGKSNIRNISILSDVDKSAADVALYKKTGRSYSYVGTFPQLRPSIVLYYGGFYDDNTIDPYLGRVLVHELSHGALKVYDEYIEPGVNAAKHCFQPLASDNSRQTMMNDHRRYTRYSHPEDYAGTPPARTAQYRCYGESAWEVLLQPKKCDSNLSLDINVWFPRRDYFAEGSSCSPDSIPSLATLRNPANNQAVQNCINKTKEVLDIKLLSGVDNVVLMIGPAVEPFDRELLHKTVARTLDFLAADAQAEALYIAAQDAQGTENLQDEQAMPKKRITVIDAQGIYGPQFKDLEKHLEEEKETVRNIVNRLSYGLDESQDADDMLDIMKMAWSDQLDTLSEDHNTAIVIAGKVTKPSAAALDFFKDNNIAIHTIGIAELSDAGLRTLAAQTGGKHFTVSQQLAQDNPELLHFAMKSNLPTFVDQEVDVQSFTIDDESQEIELFLHPGVQVAIFSLFLDSPDDQLDRLELEPPNGSTFTNVNFEDYGSGIIYIDRPMHRFYAIHRPPSGVWRVSVSGTGTFESRIAVYDSIYADLSAGAEILPRTAGQTATNYPEPIPIRVRVQAHVPVLNATVKARITTPKGVSDTIEMRLLDDGEAPDSIGSEGIYTGLITDYSQYGDGIYTIKAIVSNPNGIAVLDGSALNTFATTQSATPITAPSFERFAYHQVTVMGTQVPQSHVRFANSRTLRSDGTLVWGEIGESGQTHWYRFRTTRAGTHYIQTSNLVGYDGVEMATDVSLHEANADNTEPSFLAASVGHQGTRVSHIEYGLDADKEYWVSVGHVNNARGIYGLTVNSESDLLSTHEVDRVMNDSGGGGGGGGFTDSLLLALLLVGTIILYRRRTRAAGRV